MMHKFEAGRGYWATGSVNGKKAVVVALGVVEGVPTFAKVNDFGDVKSIYRIDGREFAQIVFGDDVYTASSAVTADMVDAKRVIDAVIGR